MNLKIVPEFALLSVNIKLKLGTLDTLRVRDTIDVFNVASSSEGGRWKWSDVGINSCLKIQRTRSLPWVGIDGCLAIACLLLATLLFLNFTAGSSLIGPHQSLT